MKKLTTEEFIEKARKVHGNKYDYSKVDYKNANTKVTIICPKHGEFKQTPHSHLRGQGCSSCSGNKKSSTEEFIEKAREIHWNKYDYSKVDYKNAYTKITIICPKHGTFKQKPYHHLNGVGCKKCADEKLSDDKKSSTKEFIEKARKVHGNKYDYSKVEYKNAYTKVTIICPIHGEFKQKPYHHLNGAGCSSCNESKGEIAIRNYLTEHKMEFDEQKRFNDCRYKRTLPFDFYVPKYNLCIEYDGGQHFKAVEHFGGIESFESRKKLDQIKNDYCKLHNINLLRIKYDENIEKKLNDYFQKK